MILFKAFPNNLSATCHLLPKHYTYMPLLTGEAVLEALVMCFDSMAEHEIFTTDYVMTSWYKLSLLS
jgi:hypothetical protein